MVAPLTSRSWVRIRTFGTLLLMPRTALAHPGRAPEPHDLWSAWTLALPLLVAVAISAWLYLRGLRTIRRRAGARRVVPAGRARCFALAWLTTLVALVSPLDALGAALFSAHMVQHLLLVMVAAPLFAIGDPATASLWALPLGARRSLGAWWLRRRSLRAAWRALRAPAVALSLHVAAMWLWHLPALYDRALADQRVHELEHATFFLTALLFWWVLLRPHGRRLGSGAAVLYLFAAALQSTFLGALLTLARRPLYTAHFGTTRAWGLTPLEDQQLAGLFMWVPAGLVYLAVLAPIVVRALGESRGQRVASLTVVGASARGTP
jgi:cytochrome c oxidase assembly factor CtaG